jgi:uncharacterized membrane protein
MITGAHFHLLVNHAPIFGCLFATALFLFSFFTAKDVLRRTAFAVLIASAVAGQLADMSGEPAEDAVRGFPGVQRKIIHEHEEMGDKANIIGIALGVLSLGAVIKWRRTPVPAGVAAIMFLLSAFTSGAFVYTGLLGGRIRHTEVRPGAVKGDELKIEPPRQRPPGAPRGEGG